MIESAKVSRAAAWACLALTFIVPAIAEAQSTTMLILDPRPRRAIDDRRTDLEKLENAEAYWALLRWLVTRIETPVRIVSPEAVKKTLGPFYRVELFDCVDQVPCLLSKTKKLKGTAVKWVLVSSFVRGPRENEVRFDLMLLDLESQSPIASAGESFPRDPGKLEPMMMSVLERVLQRKGKISLIAEPRPESVLLDDRRVPVAPDGPIELDLVEPGRHTLRCERKGNEPYVVSVDVEAGRTLITPVLWTENPTQ